MHACVLRVQQLVFDVVTLFPMVFDILPTIMVNAGPSANLSEGCAPLADHHRPRLPVCGERQLTRTHHASVRGADMLRTLRAFRLLKVLRVVRARRIGSRIASRISVRHSTLTLIRCLATIVMSTHWCAPSTPETRPTLSQPCRTR
jgi:hypothetical protein